MLTWDDEPIDDDFWMRRLREAIARRGNFPSNEARRLVNAENDYLPGLIVDQYGDTLVLQALSAGIDQRKQQLAEMLINITKAGGVYERSDADARKQEGLEREQGHLLGEEPPDTIEISEDGHTFLVDVREGHKTGFYLDQRDNRRLLADHLPEDAQVLNVFSYTGGFAVYAYAGGAERVVSVDASQSALQLADRNLALNGYADTPLIAGDAFEVLRDYRDAGEEFDVIILDPPKFAQNSRQVDAALRGYKDINLLAFQMLRANGLLMTFSCSGAVSTDLFRKVIFGALEDSGREAQVIRQLSAPPDHPVALTFPEGQYLKGLLCQMAD